MFQESWTGPVQEPELIWWERGTSEDWPEIQQPVSSNLQHPGLLRCQFFKARCLLHCVLNPSITNLCHCHRSELIRCITCHTQLSQVLWWHSWLEWCHSKKGGKEWAGLLDSKPVQEPERIWWKRGIREDWLEIQGLISPNASWKLRFESWHHVLY